MATSTPIFPFSKPGVPPPPVIVLLEATELHTKPPAVLLAFEDLPPRAPFTKSADRRVRFHPYSCRGMPATLPLEQRQFGPSSPSPHSSVAPSPALHLEDSPSTGADLDMSPLTSPASSPRSSPVPGNQPHTSIRATSTKIKIECPKGAARKNLQDQIKWDPAFLAEVKKHTRQMVRAHLNNTLCFKDQEPTKLTFVRQEMVKKFPRLDDYECLWPLDIIILNLLKYSSSHGKSISQKNVVNAVRGVVEMNTANSRPRRSLTSGQI